MANHNHQQPPVPEPEYLEDDIYADQSDDDESLASLETDDGQDHPPEKVLAQITGKNGFHWYLVKWQDCPVIRSSWEGEGLFRNHPGVLEAWEVERKRQVEGLSKPLDLAAFDQAVVDAELAHSQRRVLRRLRRKFNRVLSIVAT